PRRKIGFTLEEFEKLPEAERPTLYTRPMTAAEYAEVDELWSAHDNAATRGERVNALDTFLAKKLTGWERVQLPDGTTAVFGVHAPRVAFRYGQLVEAA